MKAILIDCETGGLEPATDALCSIGAVAFDTDAPTVDSCILARAHWPICVPLDSPLRVTPGALRIQGLTRDDVADSRRLPEKDAIRYFFDWSNDAIVRYGLTYLGFWAWNARFDLDFLRVAYERRGGRLQQRGRCAQEFAWNLMDFDFVPDTGARLVNWAARYGLTQPEPHNAQVDAEVAAKVLWHLVRTLKGGAA